MEGPTNTFLPFAAYGIFKPGEISFLAIAHFVDSVQRKYLKGTMYVRDGVLMLGNGEQNIECFIINFKLGKEKEAYDVIRKFEPSGLYKWEFKSIKGEFVNVLYGKSPRDGTYNLAEYGTPNYEKWSSFSDPLFTTGIKVVKQSSNLKSNNAVLNVEPLILLQRDYSFLWTILERFLYLKYGYTKGYSYAEENGGNPQKVKPELCLRDDEYFIKSLNRIQIRSNQGVYSTEKNYKIEPPKTHPYNAAQFYYQYRNNVVHRGKSTENDFIRLKAAFDDLLEIFDIILNETKAKCEILKENFLDE